MKKVNFFYNKINRILKKKGFCFLFYLENLVGMENFENFLKSYIYKVFNNKYLYNIILFSSNLTV